MPAQVVDPVDLPRWCAKVSAQVIGNDTANRSGGLPGSFELNVQIHA